MTVPLMLLALGSIGAGFLLSTSVPDWLEPVFGQQQLEAEPVLSHWLITTLSLVLTVLGAGLAWALFRNGTAEREEPAGVLVTAARRNLYTDAINEAVFERPGIYLTRALVFLDNKGVDGLVNGIAASVGGGSGRLRRLQTGFVRSYALSMLTGALLVVGAFLAVQLGWLA
jgi:NADH-quinone oxidoreductase subunit L